MALTASKIAMCTMAIARLERPGPSCSPKIRGSPSATGVWSSPAESIATWFQWCIASRPPGSVGGGERRARRRGLDSYRRPPELAEAAGRCLRPRQSDQAETIVTSATVNVQTFRVGEKALPHFPSGVSM